MKIAFVTSGLESGADGVGDYTRRLAAELARTGHTCRLVALNETGAGEYPRVEEGILRMNAAMPWPERIALAERTLEEFKPDWMSFQFVCYGFDPKGFIRKRVQELARLFSSRPTHMMFHELWVGETAGATLKQRLVGRIQRKYVLELAKRIRPRLVTATNPIHRAILSRCGLEAEVYPLFGNVEVSDATAGDWLWSEFQRAGVPLPEQRAGHSLFGFFGTIQLEWSPEPLFSRIAEAARKCGKRPVIVWIGRPGRGDEIWNAISRDYASEFSFVRLGPQPGDRVSELLNTIDAGISTMPIELIMKSGTAVAMFEHGVPVVVTRREAFRGIEAAQPDEPLIFQLDAAFPADFQRGPRRSRLPEAAAMMAHDLDALRT